MMKALITKRKSPKVNMVMGNVNITSMGFIMALKKAKTTDKTMAAIKLFSSIPGNTFDKANATNEDMISFIMKFKVVSFI